MNESGKRRMLEPEYDPIRFLEIWHEGQCQDDAGGCGGVVIEAVEGPAWWISIDLRGTDLEGRTKEPSMVDEGGGRWHQSWSNGSSFTAAASVLELRAGLVEFRRFVLNGDAVC